MDERRPEARRRRVGRVKVLGVVVGLVFVGGAALGEAVGPIAVGREGGQGGGPGRSSAQSTHDLHGSGSSDTAGSSSDDPGHAGHGAAPAEDGDDGSAIPEPSPAMVAHAGYRLDADATLLDGVFGTPFRFRVRNGDGAVVQSYQVRHERELHLFVVAHDLGTFHHLHPERDEDGTWAVGLPELAPGPYRVYADFVVADGTPVTLGTDLVVPGNREHVGLPPAEPAVLTDGGYVVELDGAPRAGEAGEVVFRVLQDGAPVTHLEPYLGAAGHLVAIRAADMAFLHVHPLEHSDALAAANEVRFALATPTPGDHRLFLDFAHDGAVHTAAFTVPVEPAAAVVGDEAAGSEGILTPEVAG